MKRILFAAMLSLVFLMVFLTGCGPEKVVVPPQPKLEFSFDVFGKDTTTYLSFYADDGSQEIKLDSGVTILWVYDRPENLQEYIILYDSGAVSLHLHASKAKAAH